MNDLFSMYAKYFGKLTFLTLRYAHILRDKKYVFGKLWVCTKQFTIYKYMYF